MRSSEAPRRDRRAGWGWLAAATLLLAACGGGNSTQTYIVGGGADGPTGTVVSIDQPTGENTTEIVVDSGPGSGFSLGVTNLPYVTVTVCAPGSTSACVTLDHVFLDTGSIGLRVLRSTVSSIALPALKQGASTLVECYPFVIGAVWGPLAQADVRIGGEIAAGVPVQLIDDVEPPVAPPTADCVTAAAGSLLQSLDSLQAKAILGVGMLRHDCGLVCQQGPPSGGYDLYYACGVACTPTAVPPEQQVQNPVAFFAVNNNGTIVSLPAVPDNGAVLARGRLVFGIGTQANNQIAPEAHIYSVDPNPANDAYLYIGTTVAGTRYPYAYVDSGSNGLFFDDPTLSRRCAGNNGVDGQWYCPSTAQARTADIDDPFGSRGQVTFSIASADALFATGNVAFANLGGAAGAANAGAFVWGLPLFFGRPVYTSIWGQALAANGPWWAF
jgi:hypothetical protein